MQQVILPRDIIEHIIDEISTLGEEEKRYSALKSCALTSRQFRDRAQRAIFGEVVLVFEGDSSIPRYTRFRDSIMSSPRLASLVKGLVIMEFVTYLTYVVQPDFHLFLGQLRNLTKFSVQMLGYPLPVKWNERISPEMAQAMMKIFASPQTEYLALSNVHLPSDTAQCIASIPAVSLEGVSWDVNVGLANPNNYVLHADRSNRLKSLTIENQNPIKMRRFLDALSSLKCSLEKLDVKARSRNDAEAAEEIMRRCHTTLTSFRTTCYYGNPDVYFLHDLSILQNLKHIQLLVVRGEEDVDVMIKILSTISSDADVREVEIEIDGLRKNCIKELLFTDESTWQKLDDLLCGPPFTKLERVLVHFTPERVRIYNGVAPEARKQAIKLLRNLKQDFLPKLGAEGKLVVKI